MRVRFLQSAVVVTTLSLAGAASAHFQLKAPLPSTAGDMNGKGAAPCGPDAPSNVITPVMGGSQIAITVNETVFHPGHYRIALSINSRDEIDPSKPGGLKEPVVKNAAGMVLENKQGSPDSASADIQNPPVFPVLADGIFAHTADSNADFTQMITLPNVTCEKCTLQVIEFMAQHGPDYFYRHCADLKITADPAKPIFNPGGTGGTGGSGAGGSAGSAAGGSSQGGTGGSGTAGSVTGGTPGTAGSSAGGAPVSTSGAGGAPANVGGNPVTGGTGGNPPPAATADESGCSVSAPGRAEGTFYALLAGLVLGLGRLGRRRKRAG